MIRGWTRWIGRSALAVALPVLAGCALQKSPPAQVLQNRDFIADPATTPTTAPAQPALATANELPPAPVTAPPISAAAASDGLLDVTAQPGAPTGDAPAAPAEDPILVDAKVGELSGRPVRVEEILDDIAARLRAKAKTRTISSDEWHSLNIKAPDMQDISRPEYMAYATAVSREWLMGHLRQQLLEDEARASLKPEEKVGLKYIVQEVAENARRESGGTTAGFEKQKQQTEEEFKREQETILLLEIKIEERLRNRVRISWKDIRQYYDRHPEIFNPPPQVTFRMIRVPADKAGDIAKVQAALDGGTPFAQVALMPENDYGRSDGGLMPVQTVKGDIATMEFFSDDHANAAAHSLKTPGDFTHAPFDLTLGNDRYKAWLFLDTLKNDSQSLSDFEVQLRIAKVLEREALSVQREAYLERLAHRASMHDVEEMSRRIGEIAAERYWKD